MNKTNGQNLEDRFDAGDDVLDYFETGGVLKARTDRRRVANEGAPASNWPEGFFESVRIFHKEFGREPNNYTEKEL